MPLEQKDTLFIIIVLVIVHVLNHEQAWGELADHHRHIGRFQKVMS